MMIHTLANFQQTMNERIQYRIPPGLILKKSTDPAMRDVTIFDVLAHYAGLQYVRQDIYADPLRNEYIITKYGFEPAVKHNLTLQVDKLHRLRDKLQYELKVAVKKAENYVGTIKLLEARNKELKEKLKRAGITSPAEHLGVDRNSSGMKKEWVAVKPINEAVAQKPIAGIASNTGKTAAEAPARQEVKHGFPPAIPANQQPLKEAVNREPEGLESRLRKESARSAQLEEVLVQLKKQNEALLQKQKESEASMAEWKQKEDKWKEMEKEWKQKEKKTSPFLMAENAVLRQDLKKAKAELTVLKQVSESVIKKLSSVLPPLQ